MGQNDAALTVIPGPDMALVTKRAIASGRAEALRTAAGITTGLLVWGVFTVVGLAAILAASAETYFVVKILGASYLVFLGAQALWQSRRSAPRTTELQASGSGRAYLTGLTTNVLNPKIAVFYTGLLPTLAPQGLPSAVGMGLLVLLHAALTLTRLGSYAYLVSRCARRSNDRASDAFWTA
nr:LysE family translocator [Streptomyces sp. MB09-02B]